jgi:hypothetical protein
MIARHYGKFLAEDRKRYAALAAPPLRLGTSSPCAREVPAGPVEDQRRVHAGPELSGEARQEHGPARGDRLGRGEGEGLVRAGPAGGEQIEAVEVLVGQAGRTNAALVPAVADPAVGDFDLEVVVPPGWSSDDDRLGRWSAWWSWQLPRHGLCHP